MGSSFTDSYGVTIHTREWPAANPKAIVQLLHGVGEHSGRYEHVAKRLNRAGYSVYADDHRGHGKTGAEQHGGNLSKLGKLGPGGLRATEAAIEQHSRALRERYPDVPLILLGHSWGSIMAQHILNRHPSDFNAVVLTGSAYLQPGFMQAGDLNKRHAALGDTGFEWLSRDPAVAKAFVEDPLCFGGTVLHHFGVADSLRMFGLPRKNLPSSLPVYIVSGDDDPLPLKDSLQRLERAFRERSGLTDVTLKIYPEARHEVFNEINKEEVLDDLVQWLDARFD